MTNLVQLSVSLEPIHGHPHLILRNIGQETARDVFIYLRDFESNQDWTGLLSRPHCWVLPAGQQKEFRLASDGPRVLEVELNFYDRAGTRGYWLAALERDAPVSTPERTGVDPS